MACKISSANTLCRFKSERPCYRHAATNPPTIFAFVAASIPWRIFFAAVFALISSSCSGPQSALDPAGHAAQWIADIFWWMTGSAAVIWLAVIVLALWAARSAPEKQNRRRTNLLIIGGGAVVPTLALSLLLLYGLAPIPALVAPAPQGSLQIEVSGEQWWWRVHYRPPGDAVVSLANEIRLPVGAPVEFHLQSPDVVHSFWIPPLGGKIDMLPGRITRLVLTPKRTGTFRGACAEYCGTSHALMAFPVVVMEPADFARWLAAQALPAPAPATPLAARGLTAFLENGCGACHSIRGTSAGGVIGPDLTHVGSRLSIGAGILPNTAETFVRWLRHTDKLKPGVHMPGFAMLPEPELQAVAAYLDGLL